LRRTIGFQGAKASIKSITAHNSKLGVNWSVSGKKFELSRSKQYAKSPYKEWI